MPSDNFTITLHRHISGKEQVSLVDPQYLPRRHGEAWGGAPRGKHPGCLRVRGRALEPVMPMLGASPGPCQDRPRAGIGLGPGWVRGGGGGQPTGCWQDWVLRDGEDTGLRGGALQLESLELHFSHSGKEPHETRGRASNSSF